MNWLFGYSRERLGLSVNKVVILKPLTELDDDGNAHDYVRVGQQYMGDSEKEFKFKGATYHFSPGTVAYHAGQVKLHYLTYDDDVALRWYRGGKPPCDRDECDRYKVASVVKSMVTSGLSNPWVIVALASGLCLVVGLVLGMNLPALGRLVSGGNATRVG